MIVRFASATTQSAQFPQNVHLDATLYPFITAPVAVNTPACVIITVGLHVGHAEKAVDPLDNMVVFPPLDAVSVVDAIVHPPIVPVSNVHDLPVMFSVEILVAVIVLAAMLPARILAAPIFDPSIRGVPAPYGMNMAVTVLFCAIPIRLLFAPIAVE